MAQMSKSRPGSGKRSSHTTKPATLHLYLLFYQSSFRFSVSFPEILYQCSVLWSQRLTFLYPTVYLPYTVAVKVTVLSLTNTRRWQVDWWRTFKFLAAYNDRTQNSKVPLLKKLPRGQTHTSVSSAKLSISCFLTFSSTFIFYNKKHQSYYQVFSWKGHFILLWIGD